MKTQIIFHPDLTLEADVSKKGILAVHRPVDPEERKRGYVITDMATLSVLCWVRRKADAVKLRNRLESSDDVEQQLQDLLREEQESPAQA